MQAPAGEYDVAELSKEEASRARIGRDRSHTSEGKQLFVLLYGPEAAKEARLTAGQQEANQRQWDALEGVRCVAGISPEAMAAGKKVAAASLDIKHLQRKGQRVRSACQCQ